MVFFNVVGSGFIFEILNLLFVPDFLLATDSDLDLGVMRFLSVGKVSTALDLLCSFDVFLLPLVSFYSELSSYLNNIFGDSVKGRLETYVK